MKQVASSYRFKVDKLIRDKMPEHLEAKGVLLKGSVASVDRYIDLLKAKLVEETRDVVKAKTSQEIAEECADVLEVIEALCTTLDVPYEKVREAQQKKRQEKGGFEKRVFGEYIEIRSDNTKALDYYQAKPEDYPLIETRSLES